MKMAICSAMAIAVAAGVAHADVFPGNSFPILDETVNTGTATVSGMGAVTSVTLSITMHHTWASDLMFVLTAPGGTQVIFATNPAGGGYTFSGTYVIDDAGAESFQTPTLSGGFVETGTYSPQNPFSAFNGIDPNGVWTLDIHDQYFFDEGDVSSWSISVVPAPGAAAVLGLAGLGAMKRRRR